MKKISIVFVLLLLASTVFAADNWKETLRKELPLLGQCNWIVVADLAHHAGKATGTFEKEVAVSAGQTVALVLE